MPGGREFLRAHSGSQASTERHALVIAAVRPTPELPRPARVWEWEHKEGREADDSIHDEHMAARRERLHIRDVEPTDHLEEPTDTPDSARAVRTGGVDGARRKLADRLEHLRLGHTRVAHETHVNVACEE